MTRMFLLTYPKHIEKEINLMLYGRTVLNIPKVEGVAASTEVASGAWKGQNDPSRL